VRTPPRADADKGDPYWTAAHRTAKPCGNAKSRDGWHAGQYPEEIAPSLIHLF
jgi:hypothetical protein